MSRPLETGRELSLLLDWSIKHINLSKQVHNALIGFAGKP